MEYYNFLWTKTCFQQSYQVTGNLIAIAKGIFLVISFVIYFLYEGRVCVCLCVCNLHIEMLRNSLTNDEFAWVFLNSFCFDFSSVLLSTVTIIILLPRDQWTSWHLLYERHPTCCSPWTSDSPAPTPSRSPCCQCLTVCFLTACQCCSPVWTSPSVKDQKTRSPRAGSSLPLSPCLSSLFPSWLCSKVLHS